MGEAELPKAEYQNKGEMALDKCPPRFLLWASIRLCVALTTLYCKCVCVYVFLILTNSYTTLYIAGIPYMFIKCMSIVIEAVGRYNYSNVT